MQWPYKGSGHKNYLDSRGRLKNCHYSNAIVMDYAKPLPGAASRCWWSWLALGGLPEPLPADLRRGSGPTCDEASRTSWRCPSFAHARTNKLFNNLRRNDIRTVATRRRPRCRSLRGPGCPERDDPYIGKVRRKASIVQEGRTRTWLLNRMRGVGIPDLVDVRR